MIKGVILDIDSLGPKDIDLSALTRLDIDWQLYGNTVPAEVAERITDAQIVLTNKAPLDRNILQASPRLQYIGVLATGTNVVDLVTAKLRNITVTNVTGYGIASVVQHTFALILSLSTRLPDYNCAALDGRWRDSPFFCLLDFPLQELEGKTLGIVGHGALGRGVAKIARAFDMKVKLAALPGRHDNDPQRVPLKQLLSEVDILSLHCPLTPETKNLIGREELALMKPHALLINCARGGIVDEIALAEALQNGTIGGAGVDVLTEEPPRHGNPLLNPDIPNLIVTPHSAWATQEARQRLVDQAANHLASFLRGAPTNTVASSSSPNQP